MLAVSKLEPDSSIALRVYRKQIDLLYTNQAFAVIVMTMVVVVMLTFLSYSISWAGLDIWGYMFSLVFAARLYFIRMYFIHKKNNSVDYKKWERIYSLGILLTGGIWSAMILWLFPVLDLKGQLLFMVAVLGITATAHTTMGYRRFSTYCFTILLLVPLIFAINNSLLPNIFAMSVAFSIYLLYIFRASTVFYNYTHDMLQLQEAAIDRENELLLQREKANLANMTKSQFLSRMSHELRTPLNVISGLTELQLLDKNMPLTSKQKSRAEKIGAAGKHLLLIVNDVLDLSRIETGEMDITLDTTGLYDVITDSINMVEELALARSITFSGNTFNKEVYVLADRTRLKQVIVNLLDNAVKYNKKGGLVTIAVESVENDHVRLSIIDTGYGINNDAVDDLFKPFSRLGAVELGIDGVGIGLSLCKQLIELMNGYIGAKCRKGEGCCFWVSLPASSKEDAMKNNKLMEVESIKYNIAGRKKILLVEDNLVNCEVAVDMLEAMGISVDISHNGLQALEAFDANKHELILMDCEMPIMDGFTATKKIRLREHELNQASVPIIALTAHAITGAREKCIASGMDDFLSKPFSMLELNKLLRKWMDVDYSEHEPKVLTNEVALHQKNEITPLSSTTLDINTGDWTVLDYDVFSHYHKKQLKDNSNLLSNIIRIYIEQTSGLLDDLRAASLKMDVEQVRLLAHTLKSSSENVGAFKLAKLCRKVEHGCDEGDIDVAEVQKILQHYPLVEKALKTALFNVNRSLEIKGRSDY